MHQSVSYASIQAQKAGEETKKQAAEEQAEAIIAKAEAQANQMVGDAVEKARRLAFQTQRYETSIKSI